MKLERDFYIRDTVLVAKELVGKTLVHEIEGQRLTCRITETEAYNGVEDKACHAYGGRFTQRTKALYDLGGTVYVFLIYGMYDCFNVVCGQKGNPCAVLIRGGEALDNKDTIAQRRFGKNYGGLSSYQKKNLLNGPGKLCQGMGITREHNRKDLLSSALYIEDSGFTDFTIETTARINIDYAQEYKDMPWRFFMREGTHIL